MHKDTVVGNDEEVHVQEFEHAQKRRLQRRQDRFEELEQEMFNDRSRYLILILTLCYRPDIAATMTLSHLRRDRDHLFANVRCNELLRDMRATVWLTEEGINHGGVHMHVVVFYDGSHRADEYISDMIGKYWADVVTNGRGSYWSSNGHKADYERRAWGNATGRIDRNDLEKRESLKTYFERYLCKADQDVERESSAIRTFGIRRFW